MLFLCQTTLNETNVASRKLNTAKKFQDSLRPIELTCKYNICTKNYCSLPVT